MDIQKTALRLPKDLHQMVTEAAQSAGHSMNAEIIRRLRGSFGGRPIQVDESELKTLIREVVREELGRSE